MPLDESGLCLYLGDGNKAELRGSSDVDTDDLASYTTFVKIVDTESADFVLPGDENPGYTHQELDTLLLAGEASLRYKIHDVWELSSAHLFEFSAVIPQLGTSHEVCFVVGLDGEHKCMKIAGNSDSANWIKDECE